MPTRLTLLALVALSFGCTRGFSKFEPKEKVTAVDATPCTSGDACNSGICADGVCCAAVCGTDEICNAPRHEGTCQPRPFGDPCDAGAQCQNGWCFDGVCCSSDCSAPCQTCSANGTCGFAVENTDPRGDCPGLCSACFAGSCGPADPGTDPKRQCEAGASCGFDQTCHTAQSGPCDRDSDCSAGKCVLGICAVINIEELTTGLDLQAADRYVLGIATNDEGDDAVVVEDVESDETVDEMRLLMRRAGEPWREIDLYNALPLDFQNENTNSPITFPLAQPVFLGRTLFVIAFRPATDPSPSNCGTGCGLTAIPITATGTPQPAVSIAPDSKYMNALAAYTTPLGELVVGSADEAGFHLYTRPADGDHTWRSENIALPGDYTSGTLALARLHGDDVFAYGADDSSSLRLIDRTGAQLASVGAAQGFPCSDKEPGIYPSRGYLSDGPVRLTVDCPGETWAMTLDPQGGAANAISASMHDGLSQTGFNSVGVLGNAESPNVAFIHYDQVTSLDSFLALSPAVGGDFAALFDVSDIAGVSAEVESLDVAVSEHRQTVTFSATTQSGHVKTELVTIAR